MNGNLRKVEWFSEKVSRSRNKATVLSEKVASNQLKGNGFTEKAFRSSNKTIALSENVSGNQ